MERACVDIPPVVQLVLDAVRPVAAEKGVALEADVDPRAGPVLGDAVRLQQIVGNIVGNAIKFTPAGGRVDVRARNDGADVVIDVVIVVSDTGRGIPRSFLPHVFEAFRQADPAAGRVHGGLGLGLAIVRALVELHHGAVEAESDGPGTGARFTVRVPLLKDAVAGRPVF